MATNVDKAVDVLRWLQKKYEAREANDPNGSARASEALTVAVTILESETALDTLAGFMYLEWGA